MAFDKYWVEWTDRLVKLSRETTDSTHPCTRMNRAFRIARAISGMLSLSGPDSVRPCDKPEFHSRIPEFIERILELAESPAIQSPAHPAIADRRQNHNAIAQELSSARHGAFRRAKEGLDPKWSSPLLIRIDQAIEKHQAAHAVQIERGTVRPTGKRIEIHGQGPTRHLSGSGKYLDPASQGSVVSDDEFIQVKHGGGFDSRAVPQDFRIPGTLVAYLSRGNASEYSLTVMEVFE